MPKLSHKKSKEQFNKAKRIIPGGVNSPVRAFKSVGGNPLFIESAKGSKIYDIDGTEYIDYVLSWGPMILGHANPKVINAIKKAADKGTSFGAPTPLEVELAQMVKKVYPSMEVMRMVNSGTGFSNEGWRSFVRWFAHIAVPMSRVMSMPQSRGCDA